MDASFKRQDKGLGPIIDQSQATNSSVEEPELKYKNLTDYPYSRRYKQLFHQYEFVAKQKRIRKPRQMNETEENTEPVVCYYSRIELSIYFNQTAEINKQRRFVWFDTYNYRNKQYFIFRDNLDSFAVFDRQMNLRHLIKSQDLVE